jgi:hypothetical protein
MLQSMEPMHMKRNFSDVIKVKDAEAGNAA